MMTTRKRQQFMVRELRAETELNTCLALDHASMTDHVWQMDVRDESDDLQVRFRTVRLPRPMPIVYPRDSATLTAHWQQRDCFLVAVANDVILGYINMQSDRTQTKGWVYDLVVGQPFRRRRIGSALIEQAVRWARLRGIAHLTLEVQTKNYPGICFARKHGFVFCGFNDHYYMNQDIALFFGKKV